MKETKTYKIVTCSKIDDKIYYSMMSPAFSSTYKLQYELYKITNKIKDSVGIFCFNKLNIAKYWLEMDSERKLFEAIGYGEHTTPSRIGDYLHLPIYYTDRRIFYSFPPEGTILFDSVKLIREIN